MTKQEIINEYYRIRKENAKNLTGAQQVQIIKRHDELMREKGYNRSYLNKSDRKQQVLDFLETYINANYDITGNCF